MYIVHVCIILLFLTLDVGVNRRCPNTAYFVSKLETYLHQ